MASNSNSGSNSINVPEARQALYNMKHEVAGELGINLKKGYNGDLTSRDAGSIGGTMVNIILPVRIYTYRRQTQRWEHLVKEFNYQVFVGVA